MRYFKFFILLLFGFSSIAHAGGLQWPVTDSPKHWLVDPDTFQLGLDIGYTSTSSNYNAAGEEVAVAQLSSASLLKVLLHGGLPLSGTTSVFAQIDFRGVSNEVAAAAGQPTTSSSGIGDGMLALRWSFLNGRRVGGRFSTAERIAEGNMRLLLEAGVVVPIYSDTALSEPDLGDGTLDLQAMLRYGWWFADDFALSAGVGIVSRSDGFSTEVPYQLRGDYYFNDKNQFRIWGQSFGQLASGATVVSSSLAGGSSLIGSTAATAHKLALGGAFHPGPAWEVAVAIEGTLAGENAAKTSGFVIGVAYRPLHETTTAFYNPKEDMKVGGLARKRDFDHYDIHAPVIRVSKRGNFCMIGYSAIDGVQIGDRFHIFSKGGLTKSGPPKQDDYVGVAEVVALRKDGTFLKITKTKRNQPIRPGMEARRIVFKDEKVIPEVDR